MLLGLLLAAMARPQGQPSFRELDLARAQAAAQAESKLVLLDFCGPKSSDCERMATTTWPSPIAQVWLQSNFVAIHVDVAADPATAAHYHVSSVPTILIANARGTEVDRIEGFVAPMDLLERGNPMLKGAGRITAARELLDATPKDPRLHWELGRAFRRSHLDQRALDELLAAWDLGAGVADFARERESLLAYELGILGRNYKPAQRALVARCEAAAAQLSALAEGVDLVRAANDLAHLQDQIGLTESTLALRDELAQRKPPPTAVINALFSDGVVKLLHRDRRYEEMLAGRGDALIFVDGMIAEIGAALREIEAQKNTANEQLEEPEQATIDPVASRIELGIAMCVMYFEALVGSGRERDARDVFGSLVALSHTGTTYARFITAAGRAGDETFAREIGDRGLAEFTEKSDLGYVRQALSHLGGKRSRF